MSTEKDNTKEQPQPPKPKKRRRTKQVMNAAERIVSDYMTGRGEFDGKGFMNDLTKVKAGKDRAYLMLKFMEFVIPKPQRVMVNDPGEETEPQTFTIFGQVVKF